MGYGKNIIHVVPFGRGHIITMEKCTDCVNIIIQTVVSVRYIVIVLENYTEFP
jgi:hypothetical protein